MWTGWDRLRAKPDNECVPQDHIPSALTTLIHKAYASDPYHALALQVLHNLRYQHAWTCLRLHLPSVHEPLPRPLVSGLPPVRVYVHPDDQVRELQESGGVARKRELEWVLPTRLCEKWSLHRFGDVFDAIEEEPKGGLPVFGDEQAADLASVYRGRRTGGKRLLLATVGDDSAVVYYVVHDGIVKPRQN